MAVKIYKSSSKVVINDGTLYEGYNESDLRYDVQNSVLSIFNNDFLIRTYDRSDIQDKLGNTFATDILLNDYLSSFSDKYGILGQVSPTATTLTTLYTVPSNIMITDAMLFISNRSTQTSFRVALRKLGASISNEHYIYYDVVLKANDTFQCYDLKLDSTDVVSVYSGSGDLSFNLIGKQISK